MHDIKNFYIAWVASVPYLASIESGTLISVVTVIILPTIFFAIGKTVDILLQIYFHNRREQKRQKPER